MLAASIFLFFVTGWEDDWIVGCEGNLISVCEMEMGFPVKGCEEEFGFPVRECKEEMGFPLKGWKSCLSLPPSPS